MSKRNTSSSAGHDEDDNNHDDGDGNDDDEVDQQGGVGSQASILEMEKMAREKACTNSLYLVISNFLSTTVVFIIHLVSWEMLVSVGLCIGITIYLYKEKEYDGINFDGLAMDTTLLSFAVVSPITLTIGMAFKRRESALVAVADLRATLIQIYGAHSFWDWGQKPGDLVESGRTRSSVDWRVHSDQVCREMMKINHYLAHFLTLPNYNRARHISDPLGVREASRTKAVASKLYQSTVVHIGRLGRLCEVLKREGLPPNEATRIRQYERYILIDAEKLRNIKEYRTPQALRSFGRIFSIILPPFFSPLFAEIGFRIGSMSISTIMAALTSIALTGLFEIVSQFEDPFVESSVLDGVNVVKELIDQFEPELLSLRNEYFPNAPDLIDEVVGNDDAILNKMMHEGSKMSLEAVRAHMRLINNR